MPPIFPSVGQAMAFAVVAIILGGVLLAALRLLLAWALS